MRRKQQEIKESALLEEIFQDAIVCRLAINDGKVPYIVPLNFGYRDFGLYFHSAGEGKKVDLLRQQPEVCFEVESKVEIVPGNSACNWGLSYRSIIGYGHAVFIENAEEKRHALDIIMAHYSDEQFEYSDSNIERTTVIRLDISSMTGKRNA